MYNPRHPEPHILYASRFYLMVRGPRQVGKKTMLLQIKESERKHVTLSDSALFFETYGFPLLIAKDDVLGRTFQDLGLPVGKRAPRRNPR